MDTEKLNNLYVLARRARDNDDADNATKYYDMILMEDPNDWEANYYSACFATQKTNRINFLSSFDTYLNSTVSTLKIINEKYADNSAELIKVASEILNSAKTMFSTAFNFMFVTYHSEDRISAKKRIINYYLDFMNTIEPMYSKYPELTSIIVDMGKDCLKMHKNDNLIIGKDKVIQALNDIICKYDPNFDANSNKGKDNAKELGKALLKGLFK